MKAKLYLSLFIILILLLPFSLSDKQDNINPDILSDSSIGYYQSTTCKISLLEFYTKNLNNSIDIYFNNNNYADVRCFGKITGVDKELVTKIAADIKNLKPVEPYKAKGIKERGQFVLRKEGKKK